METVRIWVRRVFFLSFIVVGYWFCWPDLVKNWNLYGFKFLYSWLATSFAIFITALFLLWFMQIIRQLIYKAKCAVKEEEYFPPESVFLFLPQLNKKVLTHYIIGSIVLLPAVLGIFKLFNYYNFSAEVFSLSFLVGYGISYGIGRFKHLKFQRKG